LDRFARKAVQIALASETSKEKDDDASLSFLGPDRSSHFSRSLRILFMHVFNTRRRQTLGLIKECQPHLGEGFTAWALY
jgi:hypothetical protein